MLTLTALQLNVLQCIAELVAMNVHIKTTGRSGVRDTRQIIRAMDMSRGNMSRNFMPPHWRDRKPGPANTGLGDAYMGIHYSPGLMDSDEPARSPDAIEAAFDVLAAQGLIRRSFAHGGIVLTDSGHDAYAGCWPRDPSAKEKETADAPREPSPASVPAPRPPNEPNQVSLTVAPSSVPEELSQLTLAIAITPDGALEEVQHERALD